MNAIALSLPAAYRLLIGVVVTAVCIVAFTPLQYANAATMSASELRARISELLAEVSDLQEQLESVQNDSTSSSGGSCPSLGSRDLKIGDRGAEVYRLQQFLNRDPDTRVAVYGDGSPGNETTYYGPATAAAVAKFQEKYRTYVLTPVGLTRGSGYLGASTRAQILRLCSGSSDPVTEDENEEDDQREAARDAIRDAEDALDDLENVIDDADEGTARDDAEDALSDARRLLSDAEDAYDDEDYDDARDYAHDAEDRAKEAADDLADATQPDDRCYDDGRYRSEGTRVTSYTERSGLTNIITDGYFECDGGEWKTYSNQIDESDRYDLDDVKSVTSLFVDPIRIAADDEYTEYTITLKSGTVRKVKVNIFAGIHEPSFRETGYTGDIQALIDMAETESTGLRSPLTVSASAPNGYKMGSNVTVSWPTSAVGSTEGMHLVLRHADSSAIASTRVTSPGSGSYTYKLPASTDYCNQFFSDALGTCGNYTQSKSSNSFYIQLTTFTPSNACFGFCAPGSASAKVSQTAKSGTFAIQ